MTRQSKGQKIANTSTKLDPILSADEENGTLSIAHGGGAGSISGGNFQNRVAAWIAVQILADQAPDTSWDIAEDSRLVLQL